MFRRAILLLALTGLAASAACDKLFKSSNPTAPSAAGGVQSVTLLGDPDARFSGVHPAPLVAANGRIYVYQNTGTDGTAVQASTDGLMFAPTPATYPAGVSRSIVSLPDGRYRMYYFPDAASIDVRSAVSSNGLNWTVEAGTRYSDPDMGAVRAMTLPSGCRFYFPTSRGLSSAGSSDCLSFSAEGPVAIATPDATSTWGVSAGVYLNGQYHMVLTKVPASGASELWHAGSTDGRNWNVDKTVLAALPGMPLNQPAWCISGTIRIYYRAQPSGSNAIASGIIRF